jgi:hypothetical protein
LIDDPNSAEFERISNKYKAAVAKSKPLLEETYNDRNPNRFSESRKQPDFFKNTFNKSPHMDTRTPLSNWSRKARLLKHAMTRGFILFEPSLIL